MPVLRPAGGEVRAEERSLRHRRKPSRMTFAELSASVSRSVPVSLLASVERRRVREASSSGCFSRPIESLERRRE